MSLRIVYVFFHKMNLFSPGGLSIFLLPHNYLTTELQNYPTIELPNYLTTEQEKLNFPKGLPSCPLPMGEGRGQGSQDLSQLVDSPSDAPGVDDVGHSPAWNSET